MFVSKRTVNMAHCTSDTINIVNNFNPTEVPTMPGASTAHNLLLHYIKDDDAIELKYLFEEGRVDVNHIFGNDIEYSYAGKNILQIACVYFAHETSEKCIKVLLDYGADVFYEDPNTQKNALHFAAEGGNSKILQTILKHIKDNNYDISDSNVIYSLVKHIHDANENYEAFVQILRILLTETNIDVNYEEIESGKTAVYLAAKYEFRKLIKQFLELKFNEINLDEFKDAAGKSARQLIIDHELYKGDLPKYVEEPSNINIFMLFKILRRRTNTGFEDIYFELENRSSLSEKDKYLLLRMAVKYNMEKIVEFLLQQNILFDKESKREDNPLVVACQKGYYKLLQLLMNKNPSTELVTFALFELLKSPYYTTEISDSVNYQKCIKILKNKEDVNYNGIALQYSLKYHDREMTLKYLQRGATLACKLSTGQLAITDIDATTLEAHLNKCVTYEEDFKTTNDVYLTINFTSLLPETETISSESQEQIKTGVENKKNISTVRFQQVDEHIEMRTLLPAVDNQQNAESTTMSSENNREEIVEENTESGNLRKVDGNKEMQYENQNIRLANNFNENNREEVVEEDIESENLQKDDGNKEMKNENQNTESANSFNENNCEENVEENIKSKNLQKDDENKEMKNENQYIEPINGFNRNNLEENMENENLQQDDENTHIKSQLPTVKNQEKNGLGNISSNGNIETKNFHQNDENTEMNPLLTSVGNEQNTTNISSNNNREKERINNPENVGNMEAGMTPMEDSVGKKNAEEFLPESDVIYYIGTSNELRRQLKHPVISLFLYLKWFQIEKLILFNLGLYVSFITFLLLFIIFHCNEDSDEKHTVSFYFAYVFLVISLIMLIAREIFQMYVFKYQYFLKSENWLELFLFFVTAGMLVVHSNESLMRQLSAMAIITATIEFLLLIGRLQFISTYITILRTVSYTFLKLFLLYSILLFAFAYSFYTLFKKSEQNTIDDKEKEKDKDFFEHYGMSVLKTIIMLTGEFDASTIKFDVFPGTTHLIFVAFVFLITMVLFNLLNGLAVSDTQLIKNNAELYDQIMRVELISLVERVLITKRSRKLCLLSDEAFPREIRIYPFKNWKMVQVKGNQTEEIKYRLDKNIQQAFTALINHLKDEAIKLKKEAELRKDLQEIKQYLKSFSQKQDINIGNNKIDTVNIVTNY